MFKWLAGLSLIGILSSPALASEIRLGSFYKAEEATCKSHLLSYECTWNIYNLEEFKILAQETNLRLSVGSVTKRFVPAVGSSLQLSCGTKKLGQHAEVLSKSAFKSFPLNAASANGCDDDLKLTIRWFGGNLNADSIEDLQIVLTEDI